MEFNSRVILAMQGGLEALEAYAKRGGYLNPTDERLLAGMSRRIGALSAEFQVNRRRENPLDRQLR